MHKTLLLIFFALASYCFSNNALTAVDPETAAIKKVALNKEATAENAGVLTRRNFEDVIRTLYDSIGLESYDLDYSIFRLAMIGYYGLANEGSLSNKDLITIINFSQPSTEKRFYTIDLYRKQVKYHTYVAHGRNTGENLATKFSNTPHSNQSSLGFYVTGETYVGSKGYSLRLDGKERSFNDKIRSRAVVMHAAPYATEAWIKRYGRLGRSQGCPALPPDLNREVIDAIKGKTAIFTYYPDEKYLNVSRYLQIDNLFESLDRNPVQIAGRSGMKGA